MLIDDVLSEMLAIKNYNYVLSKIKSEKVGAVLTRIKLDEELHVKVLKELLQELKDKKE